MALLSDNDMALMKHPHRKPQASNPAPPRLWPQAFAAAALLLLPVACQRQENELMNARKVYSYENRLSSISAGTDGYWIGSENGGLCHVRGQGRRIFHTPLGRIYDVVSDDADSSCLWIGSRNAGVQLWKIDGDTLIHLRTVSMRGKGAKYSPYDLVKAAGRLYAATSQGVFVVPAGGDTATSLRPMLAGQGASSVAPDPVWHLASLGDRFLYAVGDSGLVRYDLRRHVRTVLRQDNRINFVGVCGGRLYVLADNKLLLENVDGRVLHEYLLDFSAVSFYKHGGTAMFLTPKAVYMTHDLKAFKKIGLWSGLNPGAYNLALPDDGHGFAVVLAGSDECHLPHHFNLHGQGNGQQLIAADGTTLYLLDEDGFLYRAHDGETKAKALCQLPESQRPVLMTALDGVLYYVTSDNAFYRMRLYDLTLANQILARPKLLFKNRTHATAIHALPRRGKILLGVQDELLRIDAATGRVDSLGALHGKYVTQLYSPSGSDDIYVSTLNDGIFVYNDGSLRRVPGTGRLPLVQGVSLCGSYDPRLFILTGHKLMRYGGDSIRTNGDLELCFANDTTVVTLPQHGIRRYAFRNGRFADRGVEFADINFIPRASVAVGKNIYLGSELGTAVLSLGKGGLEWISFSKTWVNIWYVVGVLVLVLAVALQIVLVRRNRHRGDMKQLKLQKDDLNLRMRGLKLMKGHLTAEQTRWLDDISGQLGKMDVNTKHWRKDYDTLARLSDEVSRLNRDAALQIVKALESQMKEILRLNCHDGEALIKASAQAHESGVVDNITRQFVENQQWLDRVGAVTAKIRHYEVEMEGALRIKGVDDQIIDTLGSWKKIMLEQPLDAVESNLEEFGKRYEQIYSDESLRLIDDYMDNREQYLAKRKTYAHVAAVLLGRLQALRAEAPTADRALLLRELAPIELQVRQISTLHHLRKCMKAYAEGGDQGKENVAEIERSISKFYLLFQQADPEVVNDILRFASPDNQQVKVLVLLIADKKVKRTLLPGMLGLYGNLNPVVSRLYHGKIGDNLDNLNNYCKKHPASMTYYIVQLLRP